MRSWVPLRRKSKNYNAHPPETGINILFHDTVFLIKETDKPFEESGHTTYGTENSDQNEFSLIERYFEIELIPCHEEYYYQRCTGA